VPLDAYDPIGHRIALHKKKEDKEEASSAADATFCLLSIWRRDNLLPRPFYLIVGNVVHVLCLPHSNSSYGGLRGP
jgi:hypothetical protein